MGHLVAEINKFCKLKLFLFCLFSTYIFNPFFAQLATKVAQIQKIQIGRKHSGTPTYYIKYGKEEDIIKALKGLKHNGGVARVVATGERNVNVNKRVTMEHCFKEEGKQEIKKPGLLKKTLTKVPKP